MSDTLKSVYSFAAYYRVLGFVVICCLFTEGFSHAVRWPSGKYGLPMARSGCPKANGFSWDTGYLYQDLEDNNSSTIKSSSFHLNAVVTSSGDVRKRFCMKTNKSSATDIGRPNWPYGNYCIYKKGSSCPTLLMEGYVLWDDENGKNGANVNFHSGSLPNGKYGHDTKIFFCCQIVGSPSVPIELPIDTPFYLMAFNNKKCQEVLKTIHTTEFIRYDTENDNNHDKQSYPYPFGADLYLPYIYYCYYQACRWTKTALRGSFWSPNYPIEYKNRAWCEWYINVPSNYIISLTFEAFSLETIDMCVTESCECDYVEVRETLPNGTSALIGKYCMGVAYPYDDIKSRGNNMTVIFRSDNTVGAPGFMARYQAIQVTAPTNLASTTEGTNSTKTTVASANIPTTVPLPASTTVKSPTISNNNTSTSSSSTTSDKWTTTAAPSAQTTQRPNSSSAPTSKATTSFTGQNTTSSSTDKIITTLTSEPTKETKTARITTEQDASSTEPSAGSEPTNNATIEPGIHEAKKENPGIGNVYTIIAVTGSLIVIGGAVAVTIICFCRKREEKEKTDERYTNVTKLQNLNNVYENRASFADSIDQFVQDDQDEIKESDNPLYSSSVETIQKNNNVLYESMDDLELCVTAEAESDNPVYEGMV